MKDNLGIAFAGGGVKSVSQIALIEWLQQENLKADVISGTSAGAFIATLYALGLDAQTILEELEEALLIIETENLMHVSASKILFNRNVKHGIIDAAWLEFLIEQVCSKYDAKNIRDVKIPLAITAVDIYTGELIVFVSHPEKYHSTHRRTKVITDIPLSKAIRASMSFPLVFGSVHYQDHYLIDGGIRMNCPVPMLEDYGATKTLAITMRGEIDSEKPIDKKLDVASRVFELMSREAEYRHVIKADYHLNVPLPPVNIFDTQVTRKIFGYGVQTIEKEHEELKNFMKPKSFLRKLLK